MKLKSYKTNFDENGTQNTNSTGVETSGLV